MADVPDPALRHGLVDLQQKMTDLHQFHRQGVAHQWMLQAPNVRRARFSQFPIPFMNPAGGPWAGTPHDPLAQSRAAEILALIRANQPPVLPQIRIPARELAANEVGNQNSVVVRSGERNLIMQLQPHGFNFVRTLGYGGNGLTALFDMRDGNQTPTYFVAKTNFLQPNWTPQRQLAVINSLLCEKNAMVELMRAAHIVQVVTDPGIQGAHFRAVVGGGVNPESQEYQRAVARAALIAQGQVPRPSRGPLFRARVNPPAPPVLQLNQEENVILMEHCARGYFARVLQKMGEHLGPDDLIDSRILWHMFDCLIKACIAMEYPPRDWHTQQQWNASGGDHGLPYSEKLPNRVGGHEQAGSDIVHFDIDSANVFVGDFNYPVMADAAGARDYPHDMVPILKLGDFGTSHHITQLNLADTNFMWLRRWMFKHEFATPEQFTQEWELITTTPRAYHLATAHPVHVAGHYSHKTNLYQIACVMYEAITLTKLPKRPLPTAIDLRRIPNRNPITYGAYLLNQRFGRVSWRLRKLVMECMLERPADRPSLREVQRVIRKAIRRRPLTQAQKRVHQLWWDAAVGEPTPVRNPRVGRRVVDRPGAPYVRNINGLDAWINSDFAADQIPVLRPRYQQ
ncbi:hypothetical protein B0T19DRAFT_473287 [Cercophora scortea]|uniref:Protein kinase domain-containing protein n=1 Tax=Cercophora scortea TaxID=314031 RepID=A0AAE0MH36_9PEZI|nr:hypothetical protein B0T19DRAFT_473287 [Cercophora scortea]